MRKRILWMALVSIGIAGLGCDASGSNEASENKENVNTESKPENSRTINGQVQEALESTFSWYISRPANARITTTYNEAELAVIENKDSFLAALRGSGHFSKAFTDRLQQNYDACEQEYGAEELDEHLPCLEVDPVTVRAGFDQFTGIDLISVRDNGGEAMVELVLRGKKHLSEDVSQDRTAPLRVSMVKEGDKWLVDEIEGND